MKTKISCASVTDVSPASDTSLYQLNVLKFIVKIGRTSSDLRHSLLQGSLLSDTYSCSLATLSYPHPKLCFTQAEPWTLDCFLLLSPLSTCRQWDGAVRRLWICVCPWWSPSDNRLYLLSSRNQAIPSAAFSLQRHESKPPLALQCPSSVQL